MHLLPVDPRAYPCSLTCLQRLANTTESEAMQANTTASDAMPIQMPSKMNVSVVSQQDSQKPSATPLKPVTVHVTNSRYGFYNWWACSFTCHVDRGKDRHTAPNRIQMPSCGVASECGLHGIC